jgi:16S rRNA (cytosine967-C5)-methyltransferase
MNHTSPHPRTQSRRAAAEALVAVERDSAILSTALVQSTSRTALPFAREISSGVLRHRSLIDWTLAPLLKKPLEKLDAPVRAMLRLACYERAWLGTPPSAVANEYVSLARGFKLASASGFINAITRRLSDEPRTPPDAERAPAKHLAIQFSHPEWLVERWLARLGFDQCAALLAANNSRAALSLRVNDCRARREEVHSNLAARELKVREGLLSPLALHIEDAGSPLDWPEWARGEIIAQDEAAQLVVREAAPQAGQNVLDLAAAPGGTSTHCAQLMKNVGRIIALDVAPGRVKLIADNARRLGFSIIEARAGDARSLREPSADLVLLDAPCLGTGTLRRRPDAKWNKTPGMLDELVQLQRGMLEAAARLTRPGGHLVYSTCSLEPEENEEQAAWFLSTHAGWNPAPQNDLADLRTTGGWLQSWPHRHGTDGMFCARFHAMH